MSALVLRGGTLVLPDRAVRGAVLARDGRIAALIEGEAVAVPDGAEVIDCAGRHVLPGLVDFHVHIDDRIGAFALADTWETAAAAALPTGVTTLVAFATQRRGDGSAADALEAALARAGGRSRCDYAFHVTPTRWDEAAWRDLGGLAARGARSLKLYTTYAAAGLLAEAAVIERALARAAELDLTVLLHCEDDAILRRAAADPELDWSEAAAHARSRPPAAELRAVERAIALCGRTGGRLHVVHVSTPEAAREIRAAAADLPLTCESCPQYLALDEGALAGPGGFAYVCAPPLRAAAAREELLDLARTGALDLLATDHCAFTRADKATGAGRDARETPGGLAGLGALAPLARELLLGDAPDAAALCRFARMLAAAPARLAGLAPRKGALAVGADADLVIARLDAPPSPIRSTAADAYEPYVGWASRWRAERVYLRGRLAAAGGALVPGGPIGEPAWA